VKVGPFNTCGTQALCLGFTIKLLGIGLSGCNLVEQVVDTVTGVVSNPLGTADNTVEKVENFDLFEICIELQLFGESCAKSGTVSHTCEKQEKDGECSDDILGFATATELTSISDGYKNCQTVKGGGTAEFLMKDGNGDCSDGSSISFGEAGEPTTLATCGALEDKNGSGSCTGNVGKECVWTIQAPTSSDGYSKEDEPAAEEKDAIGTFSVDTVTDADEPVDKVTKAEALAYLC
jgi:hypothetical protein